uniref:Uncharacterized protein n=1 Tax=Rhabditophanes sp. KR3021 TaxID=114890 RepID=A0AC35TTX1_9BILA
MHYQDIMPSPSIVIKSPDQLIQFWSDQLNQRLYLIFLQFSGQLLPQDFELVPNTKPNNSSSANLNIETNPTNSGFVPTFYDKHKDNIIKYSNVTLTANTTYFLLNRLLRLMYPQKIDGIQFPEQYVVIDFECFMYLVKLFFNDRQILEPAVDKIFERFVIQIIFKGFILCQTKKNKSNCISASKCFFPFKSKDTHCKVFWCTILPGSIYLWELENKPSPKHRHHLELTRECELTADYFHNDRFQFHIKQKVYSYDFGHFDELQIKAFIEAIQTCIQFYNRTELLTFDLEMAGKCDFNRNKNKLFVFKTALEMENRRLMKVLRDERDKLRDEELVREMAMRMLFEEQDKVDKLTLELHELKKISENENQFVTKKKKKTKHRPSPNKKYPNNYNSATTITTDLSFKPVFSNSTLPSDDIPQEDVKAKPKRKKVVKRVFTGLTNSFMSSSNYSV